MANFDSYPMQILVMIARECRPNSPYPYRAWMNLKPPGGLRIPELSRARDALARAGLVDVAWQQGWQVKPSRLGYLAVEQWRAHRRAIRHRPLLFDPVVKQIAVLDQRREFDRLAA